MTVLPRTLVGQLLERLDAERQRVVMDGLDARGSDWAGRRIDGRGPGTESEADVLAQAIVDIRAAEPGRTAAGDLVVTLTAALRRAPDQAAAIVDAMLFDHPRLAVVIVATALRLVPAQRNAILAVARRHKPFSVHPFILAILLAFVAQVLWDSDSEAAPILGESVPHEPAMATERPARPQRRSAAETAATRGNDRAMGFAATAAPVLAAAVLAAGEASAQGGGDAGPPAVSDHAAPHAPAAATVVPRGADAAVSTIPWVPIPVAAAARGAGSEDAAASSDPADPPTFAAAAVVVVEPGDDRSDPRPMIAAATPQPTAATAASSPAAIAGPAVTASAADAGDDVALRPPDRPADDDPRLPVAPQDPAEVAASPGEEPPSAAEIVAPSLPDPDRPLRDAAPAVIATTAQDTPVSPFVDRPRDVGADAVVAPATTPGSEALTPTAGDSLPAVADLRQPHADQLVLAASPDALPGGLGASVDVVAPLMTGDSVLAFSAAAEMSMADTIHVGVAGDAGLPAGGTMAYVAAAIDIDAGPVSAAAATGLSLAAGDAPLSLNLDAAVSVGAGPVSADAALAFSIFDAADQSLSVAVAVPPAGQPIVVDATVAADVTGAEVVAAAAEVSDGAAVASITVPGVAALDLSTDGGVAATLDLFPHAPADQPAATEPLPAVPPPVHSVLYGLGSLFG